MLRSLFRKNKGTLISRQTLEEPRLYLGAVALLLLALIVWISVAHIDQVVRVEGRIIPAGRSQKIQHLEGGIISTISVSEGQRVAKGDLLMTIDNTSAGASLNETQVKLDSQSVRLLRLRAEIDGKERLDLPEDDRNLATARAEQELFNTRKSKLEQEISVYESQVRQHEADISEARDRTERLTAELATANQRVAIVEAMAKNNAASKMEVLDAMSRQQRLKTELGQVKWSIPRLQDAVAEEKSRIETVRSDFRAQAQNEYVSALAEKERLTKSISADADRLRRTEVRAPIGGVINHLFVNTIGGVIRPGEYLAELIPDTTEILIEARSSPRDRGYLHRGLPSEVRVSAYDTSQYGLLKGHVTEVGADVIEDGKTEPYYKVDITVDEIPDSYRDKMMVPGMAVTSDIVTGKRTILAYLLSPFRKFQYNMFRDPR